MSRQGVLRRYVNNIGKLLKSPSRSISTSTSNNDLEFANEYLVDMSELNVDRQIITMDTPTSFRRTVIIERDDVTQPFGFSLQSILIEKMNDIESKMISTKSSKIITSNSSLESTTTTSEEGDEEDNRITYISKVDDDSPADIAGLIPGDVIVAIDGVIVVNHKHEDLVNLIKLKTRMRLIVVFENMVRKIELITMYVNIEKKLKEKLKELERVEKEERELKQKLKFSTRISTLDSKDDNNDDISSGFEDILTSPDQSDISLSIKSNELWDFDETTVQYC